MATLPTREDAARYMLSQMVNGWSGRPGHVFNFRMINVFAMQNHSRFTGEEFTNGLKFAVDNEWIEPTDSSATPSFRLTEKGFAAA